MIAAEILHDIKRSGLIITVIEGGLLTVEPREKITETLRANIRAYKADLIELLSGEKNTPDESCENDPAPEATPLPITPAACTTCRRLELINIMGLPVAGCLYRAAGQFPNGWRRIPANLEQCLWN